jgi:hypothetical protein
MGSEIVGPAVTGLLALVGIGVGFAGTAWINRKEREARLRDEADGLRAALSAELRFLKDSYDARAAALESAELMGAACFDVPRRDETEVYDRLFERIVLLTADEGHKAVRAYISAKHLLPHLQRLEAVSDDQSEAPPPGTPPEGWIRVRAINFLPAKQLHVERVAIFQRAIDALDRR